MKKRIIPVATKLSADENKLLEQFIASTNTKKSTFIRAAIKEKLESYVTDRDLLFEALNGVRRDQENLFDLVKCLYEMLYLHIEVFYAHHSEIDEHFREQANLKSMVKMEAFKKTLISRLNKNNGGYAKIMMSFLAQEEPEGKEKKEVESDVR